MRNQRVVDRGQSHCLLHASLHDDQAICTFRFAAPTLTSVPFVHVQVGPRGAAPEEIWPTMHQNVILHQIVAMHHQGRAQTDVVLRGVGRCWTPPPSIWSVLRTEATPSLRDSFRECRHRNESDRQKSAVAELIRQEAIGGLPFLVLKKTITLCMTTPIYRQREDDGAFIARGAEGPPHGLCAGYSMPTSMTMKMVDPSTDRRTPRHR